MNIPEIRLARNRIKSTAFECFMSQTKRAFDLICRPRTADSTQPVSIVDIYDRGCKAMYVVGPVPVFSKEGCFIRMTYRCNCLFSAKTGLPCCHEIKVCLAKGVSLVDQIESRWVGIRVEKKRMGSGTRSTRRNTLK